MSSRDCLIIEDYWRNVSPADGIVASRWRMPDCRRTSFEHAGLAGFFTVAVHLTSTRMNFYHAGEVVWSGFVAPGSMLVTQPEVTAAVRFHSSCDVLHIFLPVQRVRRYFSAGNIENAPVPMTLGGRGVTCDAAIERLALSLSDMPDCAVTFRRQYACAIRDAIIARLLSHRANWTSAPHGQIRRTSLPAWRLERAMEFIEDHLAEPIALKDMAASAGVTRMHFAAQFRLAMGTSSHDYLRDRRIERAKSNLLNADRTILDVALACGFRSHAHFSAVFKRLVGVSPNAWRAEQLKRDAQCGVYRHGRSERDAREPVSAEQV
ncbi:AraC-type DNA-binding protein [Paraburkholderia phenazinium]|uniref:AraC-type DNA-binding protein n=2 Tax=Paraburkholderia phenazinium TaxID=60549 RepID=A0A1N6I7M0_9BURK|nr:AraC-type DNA-binding protein [Paraburkholderia phenazinium]